MTPGAPEELLGALVGVLLASSGGQKTGDSFMLASSGCQKRGIRSCWPLLVARRHWICSYVGLFWCCPVFSSLRNYFLGSHFARFCLLVLLLGCLAGVMVWHPSRILGLSKGGRLSLEILGGVCGPLAIVWHISRILGLSGGGGGQLSLEILGGVYGPLAILARSSSSILGC